ncbi:MAG TPA: hypothetical protein VK589_06105 [Chryseolinea sp.]|nr:hypothetical protein [Chryseolinea sp.]
MKTKETSIWYSVYKKAIDRIVLLETELDDLKKLIASESVYTLLRYGAKNPSHSGVDDCEPERLYYDLYNISCELRKKSIDLQ